VHGIPIVSFYLPNSKYIPLAGLRGFAGAQPRLDDGLFQRALLHQLAGNEDAADDLAVNVVQVLDTLTGAAPSLSVSPDITSDVEVTGLPCDLACVILRCPAAIPATFDYFGARDQCGGLRGTATILVAMGAEVSGG
jgi:hypothetical protein